MLPSNVPQFETVHPPERKRGGVSGGLVVTVVLVLALAAIIGVAVSRLSGVGLSRPTAVGSPTQGITVQTSAPAASSARTPAPAATTAAGAPADSATQQAIQQVIQQVDDAQVQAIKNNDPQAMAPTATSEFYQEQVNNNQDLVSNGVTEIKLLNLEWGDITVSGDRATATVWETWSTTFDDGTTEQARDRNVYTLVKDNGNWKVQADDHPDQQQAGSPTPGAAPAP